MTMTEAEYKIEIQRLKGLLQMANIALDDATRNVKEAEKSVKWARDRLIEREEAYRKLERILMEMVELPPQPFIEDICRELETPCGFVKCEKTQKAANTIRQIAVSQKYREMRDADLKRRSHNPIH